MLQEQKSEVAVDTAWIQTWKVEGWKNVPWSDGCISAEVHTRSHQNLASTE